VLNSSQKLPKLQEKGQERARPCFQSKSQQESNHFTAEMLRAN